MIEMLTLAGVIVGAVLGHWLAMRTLDKRRRDKRRQGPRRKRGPARGGRADRARSVGGAL